MSSDPRSRRILVLAAAAASWTVAACHGADPLRAPAPTSLAPASGSTSSDTPVAIVGAFPVKATQSAGGPESNALDATYRAWLGDAELQDVTWVDDGCVEATVPAGIAPGVYPLRVVGPYGVESQLDTAFTVLAAGASTGPAPAPEPGQVPAPAPAPAPAGSPLLVATVTSPLGGADFDVGKTFAVVVAVRNGGTGAARAVRIAVTASGTGSVAAAGTPSPPVDIAAGDTATFSLPYRAVASGAVRLVVTALGTDPAAGGPSSAPPVAIALLVETPGS